MSDQPTPCDTPPGEQQQQQEPTVVEMAVVGSSTSAEVPSPWSNENAVSVHEGADLCDVSPLNNNTNPSADTAVSFSSTSSVSSAITHINAIVQDGASSANFIHSGIIQDADSTSASLGVCEDGHMLVDGPLHSGTSVQSVVSQEPMAVSQDSDNSDDHMAVVDNLTAQEFLQQPDLLNAATSVLQPEKASGGSDDILGKSDLSHNLISSLDHHQSVSSTHQSEPMSVQNLLQDQSDLGGSVPTITGYHIDHSRAAGLAGEGSSDIHIDVNPSSDIQAENMCFSSSSASSTSGLSSDTCISTGVGLPPVSTIIRSSVAKGRFDAFCRPSNINMIMNIPQFLNSSGSFDAMSSMGAIQRISPDHCDVLTAVSLTSPLEVPSSRQNSCTDLSMESVDVPLSSSLVCSTSSSDLSASVIESRCIKPTSSVMSSLGPDLMDKQSSLSDARIHPDDNLSLSLNSKSSIPAFPGVIPIRDIVGLGSPTQVQSIFSAMKMEDIQKVAAIREQLRSETVVSTSLGSADDSLAHTIISSHFNCREDLQQSGAFADDISQTPQSLPLLSVSAIETNVIMSTSNVDSAPKLTSSEMKVIETTKRLRDHQLQNMQDMQSVGHEVQNSAMEHEMVEKQGESSRNSSIIYSTVQDALSNTAGSSSPIFSNSSATLSNQNLVSRSSIIERHVIHSSQATKPEKNTGKLETDSADVISDAGLFKAKDSDMEESLKSLQKMDEADGKQSLNPVSPAVTASVIQQLLKSQTSLELKPPIQQRVPGGVITSVTSAKAELNTVPRDSSLALVAPVKVEEPKVKQEVEEFRNLPVTTTDNSQRTLLVNVGGHKKLQDISVQLNEDSLGSHADQEKSEATFQLDSEKQSSALPNLSAASLPAFFSNLPASAIASLQSSLKSSHPVGLPGSLPNITIAGAATPVLSSLPSDLISPALPTPTSSSVSLLLPNILSSTLRGVSPVMKPPESAANGTPSSNSSMYSGLLKSVGLSAIVKQEPEAEAGSGPLPPFTLVSSLSPLVKRELNATLATTFLNADNNASSQIPVVTIKQEPGAKQSSASASSILKASSTQPGGVASVQLPSGAPVELSVVVACSNAATSTITSPVPSQASTIAFAGNTLAVVSAASTTASGLSTAGMAKEDQSTEKKWNCTMCKNGSPCGLHPTQSQGLSASSQLAAPPPLMSGDPAKPFQCTLCGKHLASKNVYQLHLRSHSGEKPFTCNLCGHHFSQKTSLTRHMRSHTGERPFPCEACGKRFADKERIKIHMRTHTGEKPFACEVCGKRFSQKSTVKRHMSVHTGEKPFKCETCGKGFANRGNLNAHSKTHANT